MARVRARFRTQPDSLPIIKDSVTMSTMPVWISAREGA